MYCLAFLMFCCCYCCFYFCFVWVGCARSSYSELGNPSFLLGICASSFAVERHILSWKEWMPSRSFCRAHPGSLMLVRRPISALWTLWLLCLWNYFEIFLVFITTLSGGHFAVISLIHFYLPFLLKSMLFTRIQSGKGCRMHCSEHCLDLSLWSRIQQIPV